MKCILVTGGAGFVGSNFIRYMLNEVREFDLIVNLDLLTYAGNLENMKDIENDDRYIFIRGDIRDKDTVKGLFDKYNFDTVVNFAAESHVDRSIVEPEVFLTTNILGTHVLLETAKNCWKKEVDNKYSFEYGGDVKFLQISTDEVYGTLGDEGVFTEDTPIAPNSPYSASKAGADMLVRAYGETFNMPVNITRCSNNYGPYQFPEKLIPLIINNCKNRRRLPVYGDGLQIRDWLHVKDHCSAIYAVLKKGIPKEIYNIGGNNERANIDIIKLIIKNMNASEDLIEYVKDRPGHDRRYAINNFKIIDTLGWKPCYTFERGIEETIQWYQDNMSWMNRITSGAYMEYYSDMYGV